MMDKWLIRVDKGWFFYTAYYGRDDDFEFTKKELMRNYPSAGTYSYLKKTRARSEEKARKKAKEKICVIEQEAIERARRYKENLSRAKEFDALLECVNFSSEEKDSS